MEEDVAKLKERIEALEGEKMQLAEAKDAEIAELREKVETAERQERIAAAREIVDRQLATDTGKALPPAASDRVREQFKDSEDGEGFEDRVSAAITAEAEYIAKLGARPAATPVRGQGDGDRPPAKDDGLKRRIDRYTADYVAQGFEEAKAREMAERLFV